MRKTSYCFFASTMFPMPSIGNVADRLFNANTEAISFVNSICLRSSENPDLFFYPIKRPEQNGIDVVCLTMFSSQVYLAKTCLLKTIQWLKI